MTKMKLEADPYSIQLREGIVKYDFKSRTQIQLEIGTDNGRMRFSYKEQVPVLYCCSYFYKFKVRLFRYFILLLNAQIPYPKRIGTPAPAR